MTIAPLSGTDVTSSSEARGVPGTDPHEQSPSHGNSRGETSTGCAATASTSSTTTGGAALRQRDRVILRVLEHHTGRRFPGVRTDIAWGPVFPRDPGLLVWGMS